MDEETNINPPANSRPKAQQRGHINYQKWSILKLKGTKTDILDKNPPEYKRDFDGQIKRIKPKVKRAKRLKRAQLRKERSSIKPKPEIEDIKLIKVGNKWVNERI